MSSSIFILLEFVPICIFFISMRITNIFVSTALLMIFTVICVSIKYFFTKKASYFLIFSCLVLIVMGSLTLIFKNSSFIKMKPTIVYLISGISIYIGIFRKKFFLKDFLVGISLSDNNWSIISKRVAFLCLMLSCLNECIWRFLGEQIWVNFKFFGMPIILFLFIFSQKSFIEKNKID